MARSSARNLKSSQVFLAVSLVLGLTQASKSLAATNGEAKDWTIHHEFESARALGMGNAFTAVADDFNALFYNPAGLARLEEGEMNFFVQAMIDKDFIKFTNDIKTATKSTTGGSDTTAQAMQLANLLQANEGHHYSLRAPTLGFIWARPRWGFGIIPADLTTELEIHRMATPAVSVVATQDTTIAYGRGWNIKSDAGLWSVGATAKVIYRGYFNKSLQAADLLADSNIIKSSDAQEGMSIDGDIGALYSLHVPDSGLFHYLKPTFGLTVHNVVNSGFTKNYHLINKQSLTPPKDGRRFDFGTMFALPDWWVFKSRFAFDVRDVGHENWTFMKGSHVGLEFLWKMYGWWQGGWRVGMNEGYITGGFTGLFGIFQLDLVTYGEEVGPSTEKKQNRRYMVKASLDF